MMTQTNNINTLNDNYNNIGIFEYINDGILRVYGSKDDPWFSAKDVASILGYYDTNQAIRINVDIEDRKHLENDPLMAYGGKNIKANSVLINESGLYSLILRSKKTEAKQFKRWVTSEVLPKIRKTGTYQLPLKNDKQIKIEETKNIIELYNLIDISNGLDQRDKLFFRDYVKNIFLDAPSNLLEMKIENQEWSVSRRLKMIYGINDTKEIKKMAMNFGRIMCKKYKEINNNQPIKRAQYVDGTVRDINCYFEDFWVEHGDDMLEEYFKDFLKYEEE